MTSVAGIPSLVMTHLAQGHDEQMGQLLQSNQLAGMDGRRAQNENVQHVPALGLSPLHAAQIAGSNAVSTIPGLPLLPLERGALRSESSRFGTRLLDETPGNLFQRTRHRDHDSGSNDQSSQEHELAHQMEFEARRTILQVALMIRQRGMFNSFLVINLYQEDFNLSSSKNLRLRQMIVVADTDGQEQQVPAHATLVCLKASGRTVVRRLPGQLVWGKCGFAPDWVAMHLEQDADIGMWRLHGQGFQDQLAGVALASGDIPAFSGNWADASLHMPGAARYWVSL